MSPAYHHGAWPHASTGIPMTIAVREHDTVRHLPAHYLPRLWDGVDAVELTQ